MWLAEISDDDLETLWTILFQGVDSPGVMPIWAERGVRLLEQIDNEIHRRICAKADRAPEAVSGLPKPD